MKYWKVECSNGLCGCDDNFVTTTEDNYKFTEGDLLEKYVQRADMQVWKMMSGKKMENLMMHMRIIGLPYLKILAVTR